jgi:hypothetical protein
MQIKIRDTQAMPTAFLIFGDGEEMSGWVGGGGSGEPITMSRQDFLEARRFLLALCEDRHTDDPHLLCSDAEADHQRVEAIIRVGRLGYYVGFNDDSKTLEDRALELARWKQLIDPGLVRAFELGFRLSEGPITERERLAISAECDGR